MSESEIIYQYWMNADTGRVTKREIGDPPYGDLWFELDSPEEQEQQVCPYCNGTNMDLDGDSGGGCTHCFNGYIK